MEHSELREVIRKLIKEELFKFQNQILNESLSILEADDPEAAATPAQMVRQFTKSSILDTAVYGTDTKTLTIKFITTPQHYSYFGVPKEKIEKLFNTEKIGGSAGSYFSREIKNHYPFVKHGNIT